MKRTILLGLGLIFLLGTSSFATERLERLPRKDLRTYPYGMKHWRGKRGRKYVRRMSLAANLTNDKLAIYDSLGYTPHRLRFSAAGKRTERWKYYSLGVEFWFDEESKLIKTTYFPAEADHID